MLAPLNCPCHPHSFLFCLIISLLLRRLLENPNPGMTEQYRATGNIPFLHFFATPDNSSVSRVRRKKRMMRRYQMLYTGVCPRSQFLYYITILFTSKNENKEWKEGGEKDCYPLCTLLLWRCALYLKIRQSCFVLQAWTLWSKPDSV